MPNEKKKERDQSKRGRDFAMDDVGCWKENEALAGIPKERVCRVGQSSFCQKNRKSFFKSFFKFWVFASPTLAPLA